MLVRHRCTPSPYVAEYNVGGQYRFLEVLHQPRVLKDYCSGDQPSEAEAIAALPAILAYDRRAVRRRFEDRFTSTRMAKDYVTAYRRLLKTHTSGAKSRLNGGNDLVPILAERPLPALFAAGETPERPI